MNVPKLNRLIPALAVFIIDQGLKYTATSTYNYGMIGGFGAGLIAQCLIGVLTVALASALLFKARDRWAIYSLSLILGGAASNLFDRLVFGVVRDYLNLGTFGWVNFADFALFIGVVWAITVFFKSRPTS